jgi:hypothetical protein
MKKKYTKNTGLELLLKRYKKVFQIPENINYYSVEDYQKAKRKFLKYALVKGKV